MAAKLNYIIPSQRFETIRDRVAQIITLELAKQKQLTSNTLFDAVVWLERFIAFDKSELPAINVYTVDASYDNNTPVTSRAKNRYHIDVHLAHKHVSALDGDKSSSIQLQKLIGVIRTILRSHEYNRLDFENGIIQNTEVQEIKIGQPNDKDGGQTITGRLTFNVTANEICQDLQPIDATGYETVIKIGETEQGYYFETLNT